MVHALYLALLALTVLIINVHHSEYGYESKWCHGGQVDKEALSQLINVVIDDADVETVVSHVWTKCQRDAGRVVIINICTFQYVIRKSLDNNS